MPKGRKKPSSKIFIYPDGKVKIKTNSSELVDVKIKE